MRDVEMEDLTSVCSSSTSTFEPRRRREWNDLPVELKRIVCGMLCFQDKQNMMLTNWESFNICSMLPNKLNEISIHEFASATKTSLTLRWKNEEGRVVHKIVNYRSRESRQTFCPEHTLQAFKAFLRIWKRSKTKNVAIDIPCFEGLIDLWNSEMSDTGNIRISLKCINMRTNDYRLVESALKIIKNSKLDISLLANDYGGMDKSIFKLDKVREAKSVILWSLTSNIDDFTLCSMKASNIRIRSENVTNASIIKMLQEWQAGKRKIQRLHISSPNLDLNLIVRSIYSVGWKYLVDICQELWTEVDEEGYSYATKTFDLCPAAFGIISVEDCPTFIFRVIKMSVSQAQKMASRCSKWRDIIHETNELTA